MIVLVHEIQQCIQYYILLVHEQHGRLKENYKIIVFKCFENMKLQSFILIHTIITIIHKHTGAKNHHNLKTFSCKSSLIKGQEQEDRQIDIASADGRQAGKEAWKHIYIKPLSLINECSFRSSSGQCN